MNIFSPDDLYLHRQITDLHCADAARRIADWVTRHVGQALPRFQPHDSTAEA